MIQLNARIRFEDAGALLTMAAPHHGASVMAVTDLGRMLPPESRALAHDAQVFTIWQSEIYAALLTADLRFAAYLPCRIAVLRQAGGVTIEALSPKKFCETIQRPDLERVVAPLEDMLREILKEAASGAPRAAAVLHPHASSGTGAVETQVNHQATIPQRIDGRGTKIEDVGGTGNLDAPGG